MSQLIETIVSSADDERRLDELERAQWKRFFRVSGRFVIGLVIVALAFDRVMGIYLEKSGHRGGIASDVERAIDNVERRPETVRVIVLGDSVAKQFFAHGAEPGDDVRHLTTNAAVTTAGHYFLAHKAMERCPHLEEIYLMVLPNAWENNMEREFTHDFFCGHFHSWAQVKEVFAVKRDVELSFAHAGRWLLPNLMAANSLSQPAAAVQPGAPGPRAASGMAPPPDPERLLSEFSKWIGPPIEPIPPAPAGKRAVHFSAVSRYFYEKLRNECRSRGVRLHVFPCPISAEIKGYEMIDPLNIYDAPIINDIPADQLLDGIHFKRPYVAAMRRRVIDMYHLNFADRDIGARK